MLSLRKLESRLLAARLTVVSAYPVDADTHETMAIIAVMDYPPARRSGFSPVASCVPQLFVDYAGDGVPVLDG